MLINAASTANLYYYIKIYLYYQKTKRMSDAMCLKSKYGRPRPDLKTIMVKMVKIFCVPNFGSRSPSIEFFSKKKSLF